MQLMCKLLSMTVCTFYISTPRDRWYSRFIALHDDNKKTHGAREKAMNYNALFLHVLVKLDLIRVSDHGHSLIKESTYKYKTSHERKATLIWPFKAHGAIFLGCAWTLAKHCLCNYYCPMESTSCVHSNPRRRDRNVYLYPLSDHSWQSLSWPILFITKIPQLLMGIRTCIKVRRLFRSCIILPEVYYFGGRIFRLRRLRNCWRNLPNHSTRIPSNL